MISRTLLILSMIAVLASHGLSVDIDKDPSIVSQLRTANTNLDRMKLLWNSSDWLFDFTRQQSTYTWAPGGVTNANAATFPAVVGQGMTMVRALGFQILSPMQETVQVLRYFTDRQSQAMLNLGACSLLPPHLHPRASNFVVAIKGTTQTIMINENGAGNITQTLAPGQMTIFPAGTIHTMINVGCEDAQLISALNSEDSGTLTVANALFGLPINFLQAAIGQSVNIEGLRSTLPPVGTGSIWGLEECINACKSSGMNQSSTTRFQTRRGRDSVMDDY